MSARRGSYIALALVTIALGVAVHFHGRSLGPVARDVIGDALWAVMMAWWVAALVPGARSLVRGAVVFAICCAVEISQLFHTSALDALRSTTVGHLILGSGFDPRDFAAYAAGVVVAMGVERAIFRRRHDALES